jgi:AMP-binding enzyme
MTPTNLIQTLRHRAELQPGVPAIVDRTFWGDRVLSYAALNRSVDFLALRLSEEGIRQGDQVLMLLDPSQELYLFLLALFQIGAVPALCDSWAGLNRFSEWLNQSQPQACILPQSKWLAQRFHRQLRPIPKKLFPQTFHFENRILRIGKLGIPIELPGEALALIELKRGSTGNLTARGWTQPQLARSVQRLANHLKMKAGEIDLCERPLLFLANIMAGVTSVIPVRPGPLSRSIRNRQVEKFKPVRVTAPSGFLLHYLRISSSPLHKVFVLDAPLPLDTLEFFVRCQHFANIELLFGEDLPLASCSLPAYQSLAVDGWVGDFFDDVRIRVEAGEASTDGNQNSIDFPEQDPPPGELLISGDFLPKPLNLDGKVDHSDLVVSEKGEEWIRTGHHGSLNDDGKFTVARPKLATE